MLEKKEKVIFVKAGDQFHTAVKTIADALDTTVSQFAREAIKEKIQRETRKQPDLVGSGVSV